jgi:phosphohistidine phosphatase
MIGPVRLYLVRHAQAEANHPLGDSARRLTPEGRAAFRARVEALAADVRVSRILTSPYARARESAELLGAVTGAAVETEEAAGSGRSSAQELIRIARVRGDGTAIVGHNPEISDAVAFVAGREVPVPPGTVACLEVTDEASWPRLLWIR